MTAFKYDSALVETEIKLQPQYYTGQSEDEARTYIHERYSLQKEALARSVMYALEIGSALNILYPALRLQKRWQNWVAQNCPFSVDAANNYRNLFVAFCQAPQELFGFVNLRDLYTLATSAFTPAERQKIIEQLLKKPSKDKAKDIIELARYPELLTRVENREMTLKNAQNIAQVLPGLDPLIRATVLEKRVSDAVVASKLQTIYKEFLEAGKEQKPHKTWMDIIRNKMCLQWPDKFTGEMRICSLEDANEDSLKAYMSYRQSLHFGFNERWRSRASIINRDGLKICLELICDHLPLGSMEHGSIEVELLPSSWKSE